MSVRDKWVRRFSVDETTKHKNGFTIYKITSVLFPLESPEAVTVVSVWKRYSDVQRLHASMRSLHAGLHLRGTFPALAKTNFFKRFQQEVIVERAKCIKTLLEFVAEHRLLFASTDFVNFLQTGYPEPEPKSSVINAIRSSLHLPIEETPPLEYQTSDDDSRSPTHSARSAQQTPSDTVTLPTDNRSELDVSQIPIYEAADVEIRASPRPTRPPSPQPSPPPSPQPSAGSFGSITSLSIDGELYEEVSKMAVDSRPCVKSRSVLPDLINFDAPSTSKFEDYHTMYTSPTVPTTTATETTSLNSTDSVYEDSRSVSKRSLASLSNVESKTRTEDSYVFEAGYMLNLAARCEDAEDYQRAFECYKAGIEKMLIGVQGDSNPERRAIIKEKTTKYLSHAEAIYRRHLSAVEHNLIAERECTPRDIHCALPLSMVRRSYEELATYRVLGVLGRGTTLVLREADRSCYAMKVIQKVPNNLTEFDEYFLQRVSETREPVLPTVVPYMVPLHALIETAHLYFLILAYAPGKKLFDYIKNYSNSLPDTPTREVNLENVFAEPKFDNDSDACIDAVDANVNVESVTTDYLDSVNENVVKTESTLDVSVSELVMNSQKLLMNVDRVLSEVSIVKERAGKTEVEEKKETDAKLVETPSRRALSSGRGALPAAAVRTWGAELLTALEGLHNCGVVCRDLNPTNILLGERGQIILTYFVHYPGSDMALMALRRARDVAYIAPELAHAWDGAGDEVCDYWSFGAVMYELLCGVPLSYHHRQFTSHTVLRLPAGLPVDAHSLLTQLLTYEPSERLGSGPDGIEEIKRHPYFRRVDWRAVRDRWLPPD